MIGITFGESVSEWVNIDADLMLFVFLPPLIFGEAMYLNWYYFKGGLVQSFLLAGPGVLIGAALMGVFIKLVLPYNWPWNLSMLLGSILSATDTVAMVALLKSVGASPKLTILIVGESLLNDGSAMVLFTIFYNSVNGTVYTAQSILSYIFATVLGSLALGAGIGILALRWLRSANRPLVETDVTIQIAVTICCSYLTFFLAENTLEISGVLACVSAGTVLAWLAPPIILDHESMHTIWGMVEWSLNTVIFLLAGLIIGHRILQTVSWEDWFYVFVLYLALNTVRAITIAILYPAVSTLGHRCTPKEAVFMSWAGLRGALGMALALIVEHNCPDDIHDQTSRLFFYVGGIAALTLLINATTAKSVLLALGLVTEDSPEKALVTSQIKKKLKKRTDRFIGEMTKEFELTPADIEEVRMSCTLLHMDDLDELLLRDTIIQDDSSPEFMSQLLVDQHQQHSSPLHGGGGGGGRGRGSYRHLSTGSRTSGKMDEFDPITGQRHRSLSRSFRSALQSTGFFSNKHVSSSLMQAKHMSRLLSSHTRGPDAVIMPELVHYVRAIFLEIVRVKYWHLIEVGKLPRLSFSAQFLLYTIEMGLDKVKEEIGAQDWSCLEAELSYTPYAIRGLQWYQSTVPLCFMKTSSKLLASLQARKEKRSCYMLSAFIEAHEHAQKKIHSFLGLDEESDIHYYSTGGEGQERGSYGDDESTNSSTHPSIESRLPCPEEIMVIQESKRAVRKHPKNE